MRVHGSGVRKRGTLSAVAGWLLLLLAGAAVAPTACAAEPSEPETVTDDYSVALPDRLRARGPHSHRFHIAGDGSGGTIVGTGTDPGVRCVAGTCEAALRLLLRFRPGSLRDTGAPTDSPLPREQER